MIILILDIRDPVDDKIDPAAIYVALSSATVVLEDLYLLFPVRLKQVTQPRNGDVVAMLAYLQRLDNTSAALFFN